jgi:hypothetical protein
MKNEEMQGEIIFPCDEKCRICPYPGANCKTIRLVPVLPERETDMKRVWMDPELQDELIKKLHLR